VRLDNFVKDELEKEEIVVWPALYFGYLDIMRYPTVLGGGAGPSCDNFSVCPLKSPVP
jgi:hypothetical protein